MRAKVTSGVILRLNRVHSGFSIRNSAQKAGLQPPTSVLAVSVIVPVP